MLDDYEHTRFPWGARILDVGCGTGEQLRSLAGRGCVAIGVDVALPPGTVPPPPGVHLVLARAEHLPFRAGAFDGALSKVVLPYTDEALAVSEIARVLRRGATCELSTHGLGYYLEYLLLSPSFKRRVYALRTVCNTLLYRTTGARWVVGDTVCQSLARLKRYCRHAGVRITHITPSPPFLGLPVFLYLRLVATDAPSMSRRDAPERIV